MSRLKPIAGLAQEWRPRIGVRPAVLVPCFNEEAAIGKVLADFRAELPEAAVYVYDNNSTDRALIARLIEDRLDMVVAARVEEEAAAYRPGYRAGNRLLTAFFASRDAGS